MEKGMLDTKTGHEWVKQNLMTQADRSSLFDVYYCVHCRKMFRRRGFTWRPPQTICKKHAPTSEDIQVADAHAGDGNSTDRGAG